MTSLGPGNYVVIVLLVGGSKASDFKLVLQREPRTSKTWCLADLILPNEAPVDDAVREWFEITDLTMTIDYLTRLNGNHIRVSLPDGQHLPVYVFLSTALVPYVTSNLRTPAKVEHALTTHSTVHLDGSCVVLTIVDIDGLSLTPSKIGLVGETQRKFELLRFGYVARWEFFRGAVIFYVSFFTKTRRYRGSFFHLVLKLPTMVVFG
jgi:hypothetical protein